MKIEKKNLAESVYTKLKNIALNKNRPTQELFHGKVFVSFERFQA